MSSQDVLKDEVLLYQTEDGKTRVDVRLQGETVWLTQAQMAELFQTTKQNISLHVMHQAFFLPAISVFVYILQEVAKRLPVR